MVISASLQACGVVFPFAIPTSICRSIVTICSGLYLLIGMTRFSSKWILSHSTWHKFRRSRQDRMDIHKNARLTLRRREDLVQHVARGAKTVAKWVLRFRRQGPPGLFDRSSRPRRSPRRTSSRLAEKVVALRRQLLSAYWIAPRTQ